MNLQSGEIIKEHSGENRWKIIGMIQKKNYYSIYKVEDQKPNLKRNLYLMILNYDKLPRKNIPFEIHDLRHSFYQMAKILCMNYTFLPEPVDLIRFTNTSDNMDDSLRDEERGLVFYQPEGFQLPQQKKTQKEAVWKKIKTTVRSCSKTLFALHQNHVVIRSLPLYSIILSHTTYKPYFFGFDTLIQMDHFKGYNSNHICLRPEAAYSAPECFDPRGYLSPATDIYALGKLVLQIILPEKKFHTLFSPNDPFQIDIQNHINALNLPPFWTRFLSLSLNPDPSLRFQNTYELEQFFVNDGKTPQKSKPYQKKANPYIWQYQTNPQLPSAALAIWSFNLTQIGQIFDYKSLYRKFIYQYNFTPRLFFLYAPKPPDISLPFFKMLKETYKLDIIHIDTHKPSEQTRILFNQLIPESIHNLIIVGDYKHYAIQELFRHPKATDWNIVWIRSGEGQAPIPVDNIIDASLFIRKKK